MSQTAGNAEKLFTLAQRVIRAPAFGGVTGAGTSMRRRQNNQAAGIRARTRDRSENRAGR
jgi:hypothetical protein